MNRFVVRVKKKPVLQSSASSIDVGTRSSCAVPVNDPVVAARHARIEWKDGEFLLSDVGSKSGTFLNGVLVRGAQTLQNGDSVVFGRSRLLVTIEGEGEAATLSLDLAERSFFHADSDTEEWVRSEVRFGRSLLLRTGNIAAALAALLFLLGAFFANRVGERIVEPGPLAEGHAALFDPHHPRSGPRGRQAGLALAQGCETCHELYNGTPASRCEQCHEELVRNQHPFNATDNVDAPPSESKKRAAARAQWDSRSCASCHVDHRGAEPAPGTFIPTIAETQTSCDRCHPGGPEGLSLRATSSPAAPRPRFANYVTFPHDKHVADAAIACNVCHELNPSGSPGDDAPDYRPVSFESCMRCHSTDDALRPDELADLWAGEEHRYRVDWHGTEEAGNRCLQCHTELYDAELKQTEGRVHEAKSFRVTRRSHSKEFREWVDNERLDCSSCHRDGAPLTAGHVFERPFWHGVHVSALAPNGADEAQGLSRECLECHVEQVGAARLSPDYLGATGGCGECHLDDDGQATVPTLQPASSGRTRTRTDFPHAPHLNLEAPPDELARGCYACHDFGQRPQRFSAQPRTTLEATSCMPCHMTHAAIGGGSCAACHTQGDRVYSADGLERTSSGSLFDHRSPRHRTLVESGDCLQCHAGTERARTIAEVPLPSERATVCLSCHVEARERFHWR